MKKIITFALVAILALGTFSMVSCDKTKTSSDTDPKTEQKAPSTEADNDKTNDETDDVKGPAKRDKLVIYTNAEFAPFEYKVGEKIVGVDIDICQKIADKFGAELEIVDTKFESIIVAVTEGKADIGASGFTITADRLKEVNFSDVYYEATQHIIVPKDSPIESVDDLAGKTVAVQQATTGHIYMDELKLEGTTIVPLANANVAALGLGDKYDAIVIDDLTALNIATVNGFDTIKIEAESPEFYGLAISKEDTELLEVANQVIKEMIDNNQITDSLKKHIVDSAVTE
ncbi:MAG: transporter substrate-binding domain-containing protein [Clostridia bacterium]|nr:transporter substrate-binding domain-containing protein [Clostridia bacterium]